MTQENIKKVIKKFRYTIYKRNAKELEEKLISTPDECLDRILNLPLKSARITLLLSYFLGIFGADRFYLGHTPLGIAKLVFMIFVGLIEAISLDKIYVSTVLLIIIAGGWWSYDIYYTTKIVKTMNYAEILYFLRCENIDSNI